MENNSNPVVFIAIVAVFVVIFGYLIYAKIKRKSASWVGTVIDKNVTETATSPSDNSNTSGGISFGMNRNAINRNYNLKIRSDSGEEFNWPVGQGFYDASNVGDRLSKAPGTETPTKIGSNQIQEPGTTNDNTPTTLPPSPPVTPIS